MSYVQVTVKHFPEAAKLWIFISFKNAKLKKFKETGEQEH